MVGKQEKETIISSEAISRLFDAWEISRDSDRNGKPGSATVGGVTVTHMGVTESPKVKVEDSIIIKSRK